LIRARSLKEKAVTGEPMNMSVSSAARDGKLYQSLPRHHSYAGSAGLKMTQEEIIYD